MKYEVYYTNRFRKDLQLCRRRGFDISLLQDIVSRLAETGSLPAGYHPHKLQGKYKELWECHIRPDWLLVWKQDDGRMILLFTNTGTHADLFG